MIVDAKELQPGLLCGLNAVTFASSRCKSTSC